MITLKSPNTVLANAVEDAIDVLRPRLTAEVDRVVFTVGTQINGLPHVGTHLVQSLAFLVAEQAQGTFGIEIEVEFYALDNAPAETVTDHISGHVYQRTYHHVSGAGEIAAMVTENYSPLFDALSRRTGVSYRLTTYTEQQDTAAFRAEFLRTLELLDEIRWHISPSHGSAHIRLPCPQCGWAEKYAERTRLIELDGSGGLFETVCFKHGHQESDITPLGGGYLDLATLYRNVVKERCYRPDDGTLHVMVKGADWAPGCQLVDGAHFALGGLSGPPLRIFTPQILGPDGGKLSKSMLREMAEAGTGDGTSFGWMLNPAVWPGSHDDYVGALSTLGGLLLSDPKNFYRSYTTDELDRLMTTRRPAMHNSQAQGRPRKIQIYKQYFDMIADGSKTVEVRVAYDSMKRIAVGDLLEFTCREESCLTKVTRVGKYKTFYEMFGTEKVEAVNPYASEEEQLEAIRGIFPAHKEALGVLTFELELVKQ